jgi:hypothetical protein
MAGVDSTTSSLTSTGIPEVIEKKEDKKYPDNSKITSDTDLYFNLLANPDKINADVKPTLEPIVDSTSKIESDSSDDSSESSRRSRRSKSSERSSRSKRSDRSYGRDIPMGSTSFKPTIKSYESNVPKKILNEKELRLKKIEMLRKLSELKSKGYELSKDYNFHSSLEDMEYEYELLKSYADKNNGVKLYKNLLVNGVALVEFFNEKYDPFDFQFEGWSEHMSLEVDSYDEVMEELYEKYRGSGKSMPPEIKLMFLVTASGAAFHYSKAAAKKGAKANIGANMGTNMGTNMMANMMNKPKEQSRFMTPQEIHLEKLRNQQKEMRNQRVMPPPPSGGPVPTQGRPVVYGAGVTPAPVPISGGAGQRVTLSGNASDILNKIKAQQNQNRIVSETTIDSDEMRTSERKRRGRKPNSVIHIET